MSSEPRSLSSPEVKIDYDERRCFLGLGSNLGRREQNLTGALQWLMRLGLEIDRCSSLYQTEPLDVPDQPEFLNLVCQVGNAVDPFRLLAQCQEVEKRMGRRRYRPGGPRIIDIDVLFCGGRVIDSVALTLPHPRLRQRRFVLVPLAEIASDFVDPVTKKKVGELLRDCSDASEVAYFAESPVVTR